jgi:hypothetical protein
MESVEGMVVFVMEAKMLFMCGSDKLDLIDQLAEVE